MGVAAQPVPSRGLRGAAATGGLAGWWRRSPAIGVGELALLAAGAIVLAIVVWWPLILNLGTTIPKDLGDPLPQAWQVAWNGHAFLNQPLHWFDANQFWPEPDSLAFSDALVGYFPFALFGEGPVAAVAKYDVVFLLAYALAFAGAYLLARELGVGRGPAAVAGAAFALAPWRLEQAGHLHVISSGGIPLTLFLLLRGLRRERVALVLGGFAVAAWQISLGWTLGLQLGYLLVVLVIIGAVLWWRAGRPRPPRRIVVSVAGGTVALLAVVAVLMQPYLAVVDAHPDARRTPADVIAFSSPVSAYLVAPDENLVWGDATAGLRDRLHNVPEQTLFPGLAIVVLALLGVVAGRAYPRGLRIGLLVAAVVVGILALGFHERLSWLYPYRWLYEVLPGWQAVRVPGRLTTLVSLALALLAAGGAAAVLAWVRRRGRSEVMAGAVACLLAGLVVIEGSGFSLDPMSGSAQPTVPRAPAGLTGLPEPQLHLPANRPEDNRRYLLWSTAGFPKMVNGRSSNEPESFRRIVAASLGFPDRVSVASMRAMGVQVVVVHPDRVAGTPWADALTRPTAGLGITRERRGDVVVFGIPPRGAIAAALCGRMGKKSRPRSRSRGAAAWRAIRRAGAVCRPSTSTRGRG